MGNIKRAKKGLGLKPCPICGSDEIYWIHWYYVSLKCKRCGYETYPEDEFASTEKYVQDWNQKA